MTLSSTTNRTSTAGDGLVTAFSFPYLFFANDDLKVILVVDSTGVETTQTITTHYTVTGAGVSAGGTVTMVTPPASGETLVVIREEQFTQGLDLVENDPFPSDLVEQQFDTLTMLAQQMNTEIGRAVKLSDGDSTGVDTTLPTPVALKTFRWNAGLTALEQTDDPAVSATAAAASAAAALVSENAAAADAVLTAADVVSMTALYALFNNKYLGSYATDPTLDNDGNALTDGDLYFNTTLNDMKVYDLGTTTWIVIADIFTEASVDTVTNKTLNSLTNFINADGIHLLCRNVSGGTLALGTPVYLSGYNAGQDAIEVAAADADLSGAYPAIGVIDDADLLNNANGKVLVTGTLVGDATNNFDTSAWAVGEALYISTTAGTLTNVRPTAVGEQVQAIAKVMRVHATLGAILIQGAGRVNDSPNTAASSTVDVIARESLALNFFLDAVDHARVYSSMVDGVVDTFTDETGIDTVTSTNEAYDATGDYYSPTLTYSADVTPDMTSDNAPSGTVIFSTTTTAAWNAFTDDAAATSWETAAGANIAATLPEYLGFDFGIGNETHIRRITVTMVDDGTSDLPGAVAIQRWNGSAWVDVLTGITPTAATVAHDLPATVASQKWRIVATANGAGAQGWRISEMEMHTATAAVLTLQSNAFTSLVTDPTTGHIIVFEEDVDAVTINTDLIAYVSRDGGTTFTAATLVLQGTYATGKNILTAEVDISAQPAGTSMKWKFVTANTKDMKIHGAALQWRV